MHGLAALAGFFGADLRPKGGAMETMTARDAETRFSAVRPPQPRRAFGATLVACLYVLMVVGAPLIVRYGSDHDAPMVTVAARRFAC